MESGSVPVEIRINAIVDYEVKKLSKKAIARKYGVSDSTVRGSVQRPPRERRLKADKMLRWSILSESPSSCVTKACVHGRLERKRNHEKCDLPS